MISSPQLAGMTLANPARRHACASCTGVAGNAASKASVRMMAIGTVWGAVGWLNVGAATASVMKPRADARKCDTPARSEPCWNVAREAGHPTHTAAHALSSAARTLQPRILVAGCEDGSGGKQHRV